MASSDVPMVGEVGGATMVVISPTAESLTISREEYIVEMSARLL